MQQHVRIIQVSGLRLLVVDEVRGQVATVELHAFDDVQLVVQARAFFNGDDAFLGHAAHRFGDDVADRLVRVGRDRADLGNGLVVSGRLGDVLQLGDGGDHGLVDTALEVHRVHAGSNGLGAFADQGLGQHGGSGGAVAGVIVGARRDFLHHLRAHVLELVSQFDFLGDRDAVLGDGRRAEALFEHDVAALRAQGSLDGIGENVDAANHAGASVFTETNIFGSHCDYLFM